MCAALFFLFLHPVHDVRARARASWQALRWCDEGAYLLASQTVERFQSREGAQEALRCLLEHQERAPDSKGDALSLELEAILTPQLQVAAPPAALLARCIIVKDGSPSQASSDAAHVTSARVRSRRRRTSWLPCGP